MEGSNAMNETKTRQCNGFEVRQSWLWFLCLMLFVISLPSSAQQEGSRVMTMAELLSGSPYPLKRRAGDLTGEWKKLRVGSLADTNPQGPSSQAGQMGTTYYTQGDTVSVGANTFLIAYHPALGASGLPAATLENSTQTPRKLAPNTELDLALLNLAAVLRLSHIEPVELANEIASNSEVSADHDRSRALASRANAERLALALSMYTQDWDDSLPPKAASYKQTIYPYVKNEAVFTSPSDEKGVLSYSFNRRLEGRKLAEITEPARTILLYEGKGEQPRYRYAGKAVIAFVDGHVKLCSPEQVETFDWGQDLPARGTSRAPAAPRQHASSRMIAAPRSALQRLRLVQTEGKFDAVGTIHNVTHANWSVIRVSIGVSNAAGVRLATLVSSTRNLKPGADWRFEIPVPQKSAATVEMVDLLVSSGQPTRTRAEP
jgi:prepilin-type processing-associated H-X9-DG protein